MKRSERIKEKISIFSVLHSYNYDVVNTPTEQQFRCNLHGDGSDSSPSARAYPDSNSWYCFACGRTRDAISTVMEIEGLNFNQACRALELKYGLPVWQYKEKADPFEDKSAPVDTNTLKLRVEKMLESRTRDLPLERSLVMWEAYNMLCSIDSTDKQWAKLYGKVLNA